MFSDLNTKLKQLYDESDHRKSLDIAIESANEVLKVLSPSVSGLAYGEDALDNAVSASKFPNHKIESWFTPHPYFADDRVALKLYDSDNVEAHFYWLSDSATKARIAAGTAITNNWEDSELNQKDDSYKVGLDFFLSHDTNSLLVVVTSKNNLRVLELEGKLSNTQSDIFKSIKGAFDLPAKSQIHQTIWDALALSEVNKKFYAGVAEHFTILINHLISEGYDKEDSKLFTSRLLGRLLFVWFLRKKHIIDESFGYFDIESKSSTDYYDDSLKQLFFQTLNTPINDSSRKDKVTPYLNGGLFEAHDNDWADRKVAFPTGYFKSLYEHLEQYNFTTDESSPEYEQVAIDPEMLGRVFESLLATQSTETGEQARKAKGAFYTPREIVSYMSRESLRQYLYIKLDNPAWNEGVDKLLDTPDAEWELSHSNSKRNLWGEANRNIVPAAVITALDDLKVLDPACGSGAFPMGMLQIILKTYERLESRFDPYTTKLRIIEENIYGVDIEPMAVEISRLRAWLSIVVDSNKNPSDFKPLPNLDFKFVVANSLIPLSKDFQLGDDKFDKVRSKMQWVIGKYFSTTDKQEKAALRQEFNKQASQLTQTSLLDQETVLQKQLNSFRPFNVHSEATFFDAKLMFGLKSKAPFDVVIGNPPYVSIWNMDKEAKATYQDLYKTASGHYDLYVLFYELGLSILRTGGILTFITSNKWMAQSYGKNLRKLFLSKKVKRLLDFSAHQVFDSATVDTQISLIKNESIKTDYEIEIYSHSADSKPAMDSLRYSNVNTSMFRLNEENNFKINLTNEAISLINKVSSHSVELDNIAYISKGAELHSTVNKIKKEVYINEEFQEGYKNYIEGKFFSRYRVNRTLYLSYEPDKHKAPAFPELFENKKIIVKNVVGRGGIQAIYDDRSLYNNDALINAVPYFELEGLQYRQVRQKLSSANVNTSRQYPLGYCLGVINSKLSTWYFNELFSNGLHFYPRHLKSLMIPTVETIGQNVVDEISRLALEAQSSSDDSVILEHSERIDRLIYDALELTQEEIDAIERA